MTQKEPAWLAKAPPRLHSASSAKVFQAPPLLQRAPDPHVPLLLSHRRRARNETHGEGSGAEIWRTAAQTAPWLGQYTQGVLMWACTSPAGSASILAQGSPAGGGGVRNAYPTLEPGELAPRPCCKLLPSSREATQGA